LEIDIVLIQYLTTVTYYSNRGKFFTQCIHRRSGGKIYHFSHYTISGYPSPSTWVALLEDLEVDGFAFLEDAELDAFIFLVIAGLPATVLVFSGVSLCTCRLDMIKAGSIRGLGVVTMRSL